MTKSKGINRPRHVWTPEQDALLRELYSNTLSKDIALQIGVRLDQVYGRADALGLKKEEGFLSSAISGQFQRGERPSPATQFKPGHKPWSAGKQIGTRGRAAETQFKPGTKPVNYCPVGTVKVNSEGYQLIKVSDVGGQWERWKFLHALTWAFREGDVPKNHVIRFRDGNRLNCNIENLECVTREQAAKDRLTYPKELRQLIALRGAITRQINKRIKADDQETNRI